jgi:hypothetical protein
MNAIRSVIRALMGVVPVFAGLAALAIPVWFGAAAIGVMMEFWDWRFGLNVMTNQIGPWLIYFAFGAAGLSLLLVAINRMLNGVMEGALIAPLLALVIASAAFAWKYNVDIRREAAPALLDVTTDMVDPPHFSSALAARRDARHQSLDYAAKTGAGGLPLGELQAQLHPDIGPILARRSADEVFPVALELAHLHGWRIGAASRDAGMFEATAETLWFGFRDDIVVRLRESDDGVTRIDLRSLSREDVHDLGRNAGRVRAYLAALDEAIAALPVREPSREETPQETSATAESG